MKKIYPLFLALLLVACAQQSETNSSSSATGTSEATVTNGSTSLEDTDYYGKYEEEDLDASYESSSAIAIKLAGSQTEAGEGFTVDDQTVTITSAGTYMVSGSLTDGQLKINVDKEAKVHLIFAGVSITNANSSAVVIEQAEKVITTLAADTTNTLTDGTSYTFAEGETEPDAAFYSKDDLVLASGTYEITAKNNAIKGKDSVSIRDGNYTLTTSEGDGIQANNTEDATKGYIGIDGGIFTIQSGRDGIQAETNLSIQSAEMTVKTADGADSQSVVADESYKGMKAGGSILLASGSYTIDSADDSIHANDSVTINGGEISAATGDDGIHADNGLTINDGTIIVNKSYEGLEASVITIAGGDIQVLASDDGVNAGGGSDTTDSGQFGQDSFGGGPGGGDQADDSKEVVITGGTLSIDAEGDGLDSNGNVTMSGGIVIVNGPTQGGNGALDYNGTFEITGGTLVAAGTTDMAMNVSGGTQRSVAITFDQSQAADTLITLQDTEGNTLLSYTPSKDFQHVVISSPDLQSADYTLLSGGSNSETSVYGLYQGGSVKDASELGTLSLTDTLSNLTQSGATATTNQMGGFGR